MLEFNELTLTVKVNAAGEITSVHEAYAAQDDSDADIRKGPLGRELSVGTGQDVDPADTLASIVAARKTYIESNDI